MSIIFCENKDKGGAGNMGKTGIESEEYRTRIDLLYEIAQEAISVSEVSKLLQQILRVTQQTLKASAASLLLIDEPRGELYFQVALGEAGARLHQMRLATDSGIAGWVASNAESVLANDVAGDSRFNMNVDKVTGLATRSIAAVPIIRGEKVIGVLEMLNKNDENGFTEKDIRVLKGFASTEALILLVSIATAAICNINSLGQDHASLDGYRNLAEAWDSVGDIKDSYTHTHSQRVREYSLLAANYLSLPPQDLRDIEFGALFHDIGMIGVDSSALFNPKALTDKEKRIQQAHSQKGAEIIGEIPFLENAKDIVLHHHERYDGKGYPEKLKGESIPIGARLVAVADAFDNLTTGYSDGEVLGENEAINILVEGAGKQFCPVAVEAFVDAIRECGGNSADGEETHGSAIEEVDEEHEEAGDELQTRKSIGNLDSELFNGNVRLVVPLTVGVDEVRRFRKHLEKIEDLKIVLTGGSEEEGHIFLLSLQKPMALAGILSDIPIVEEIEKRGKNIIVTLKSLHG